MERGKGEERRKMKERMRRKENGGRRRGETGDSEVNEVSRLIA